ncbi:MAG: L-threonine 3-dehydrogenase [Deltaproteobacteria bacterium CG11_big_fil_rev_8_21_14_0_20_47_16]|nr:MAG: L-threonine 3-dehydrogenase [Deltaproteobacteria bacterium CG11_big_fil_rev_8_21_14_0_20_47_16]
MATMTAVRKMKPASGVSFETIPIPDVTSHGVLVRVKAASLCGTDLHIFHWDDWAASRIKTPMTFGHEFAGEVVEVGPQVESVKPGDHIAGETHIPCLNCYQCRTGQMHICNNLQILGVDRDGAFADYVMLPEVCCVKTDASIPWEIASIQEPFGNAVYAVSEANVVGKSVAVFGDGPTGVFAVAVARAFGATKIFAVGMQDYRLNLIRKFAPDVVINASETNPTDIILDATKGEGVDAVLEMSGAEPAIHAGFRVVKKGGVFTAFGIPSKPIGINFSEEIIFKGIRINGINGRKMFETWDQVANLLLSGRVDLKQVITHTLPLSKIEEAFELLTPGNIRAGKIVLKP